MQLNRFLIRPFVEQGLREELSSGDTTGGFLVGDDPVQTGQIYAKAKGIVCGLLLADETVKMVDPEATVEHLVEDGAEVAPGTVLLRLRAKASTMFAIERCALDWIQQLSGIATKTRRYVDLVEHTKARVTDTRKGWPGVRILQKYAVRVGGAHNHIFNLSNCILVKDNHIKIAGGIREAVATLRARAQHTFKIEVECESLDMVREALDCGVEVIMFDNMDLDEIKEGLKLVAGRAMTEASGGINERTIAAVAETGVDIISVGDLTHSVTALDVSLDVQDIKPSALRLFERMRTPPAVAPPPASPSPAALTGNSGGAAVAKPEPAPGRDGGEAAPARGPSVGIRARRGIIPALDADATDEVKRVVERTTGIDGVVAYKLGLTMVLRHGLAGAVAELRQVTDLPLIYDHQKAGIDIPSMGAKFAALCKAAGVDGLILFPVAGPLAVTEFVGGALRNDLVPIVGGDLPVPSYNASGGGYVIDDALTKIFERSIEAGADHFVIPGNTADKVRQHAGWLAQAVEDPWLFIPGIGALGGSIEETFKAAGGCRAFAIVGRGIYRAGDPAEAARTLAGEALRFA